ncbi:FAD/NAD(P)-binding domain-containing protein [Mycena epipterygia]|nr:FAD/NAD(P)-binding domain-containing protein [Mycena epipterygia]
MAPKHSPRPLTVSIVGAGIGGLAAAVSLRRNGHHIQIFEISPNKTEIDAGIRLQANALRVLQRLGVSRVNLKGCHFDGAVVFDAKSGVGATCPWLVRPDEGHDLVCHRRDLHDELRRLALGEGQGPPAQLHLNSRVVVCDPKAGTVTLGNGQIIHADVIIGADGMHSVVRTSILGHITRPPVSGWSCFRCLLNAENVKEIPELAWLTQGLHGARSVIMGESPLRTFFIYPCRSGTLINFAASYKDSNQDRPGWKLTGTREEILEQFRDFHPKFLRILDLPVSSPVLKWQLRAVPLLPTWIRGRAALLGDAAHATLPLLGQGAAMAIEEAGTLGSLFPLGTTREEVPARLAAYQTLRKKRGDCVNTESVSQAAVPSKRGHYLRSQEMQACVIEYDAIKVAQEYYDVHFSTSATV